MDVDSRHEYSFLDSLTWNARNTCRILSPCLVARRPIFVMEIVLGICGYIAVNDAIFVLFVGLEVEGSVNHLRRPKRVQGPNKPISQ